MKWLTLNDVYRIHETALAIAGGLAGVRDVALLESALARPQNLYAYGERDIVVLAATYAEAIARNHPFVDGNKRSAFLSADFFLFLHGYGLDSREDDVYVDMMESLGQGHLSREAVAQILRANAQVLQ